MSRRTRAVLAVTATAAVLVGIAVVTTVANAATGTICEQYGSTHQGSYVVMNNRWNPAATGRQCIDVTGNGFTIGKQPNSVPTNGGPNSYPAIYLGCHYTNCSDNSPLPAQLTSIGTAATSVTYDYGGSGTYDAAYDIWLDSTPKKDGVNQTEIMIWFNHVGSVQPVGAEAGPATVAGRTWEVWTGNNGQNNVVSYVAGSAITSWRFDTLDFVRDTFARGSEYGAMSWYLTSIQAGFEPWSGGEGLAITSFDVSIDTGAPPTGPPTSPPAPGGRVGKADVLNWLSALQNRSDNRIVSGFFGGYSGGTFNLDQTNQLRNQSGQYPGLLACDYGNWVTSTNTQVDSSCDNTLKDWWHNGGLVSVGIHMPRPADGNFGTRLSNFADLTDSATDVGRAWQDSLKKIGDGLSDLKAAGVVVLWRPFHEMNGDWFWWGSQDGGTFRTVWGYMYDYLVNTRRLDNLIWVYSPDCSRNGNLTDYYPGGDKVDVVGLDCYTDDPYGGDGNVVKNLDGQYSQLLGLGKPFAFTEVGPRDQAGGSFDWSRWIDAMQQRYPRTTYFLAWNDKWGPPQNKNSSGLMNHPWVINRGEIDIKSGTTPPPPPPGSGRCSAGFRVVNSWPGGFQGEITVRNSGSSTINGWTVTFSFSGGQTITQYWNTALSSTGSTYTAKPVSYNSSIGAGGSTTFGFLGSGNAGTASPVCATG